MAKRLHTILNEKYRPDTLEGYICKEDTKQKFDEFIKQQDIPHLLFAGKPGAGKTVDRADVRQYASLFFASRPGYHDGRRSAGY